MGKLQKAAAKQVNNTKNIESNQKGKNIEKKINKPKDGGVNKVKPKSHLKNLPDSVKVATKKQKNKNEILKSADLDEIVAVKVPKPKNQTHVKAAKALQNGKQNEQNKSTPEGKNKEENNKTKSPLNKPQNKPKGKPENNANLNSEPETFSPGNKGKEKVLSKKQKVANKKQQNGKTDNQSKEGAVLNKPVKVKQQKLKKKKNNVNKSEKRPKTKELDDKPINIETALDDYPAIKQILNLENVTKLVNGLKTRVAEEVKNQNNQIFSDYRYMLNVTCFKIPKCPKRMVKLRLQHSLISEDDTVCMIVKDLKRGMRVDYDPTIQFYEDKLREHGVTRINAIVPFNQLRKEYGSYEMKRKFSNLYDYFLCEGSIMGHVAGFLGKIFHKSRCTPYAFRNNENFPREIEKVLNKTSYKQGENGVMISIPVANHTMSTTQIAENILTIIAQLKTVYPGGLENIRNLHLRINMKGTSSIPLYVSVSKPPLTAPYVAGIREQKMDKLKEEANKILNKFEITATGNINRKRGATDSAKHEPKKKALKVAVTNKKVKGDNSEDLKEENSKNEKKLSNKKAVEDVDKVENSDNENEVEESEIDEFGEANSSDDEEDEDVEEIDEDDEEDDEDDEDDDDDEDDEDDDDEDDV